MTAKTLIAANTGLNFVTLPPSVTASYYAQVDGASFNSAVGSYVFPCNSTLPSFTFIVAASKFVVPGTQLTYGAVGDDVSCYGSIQPSGNETEGVFGTPFLEGIFTVFDYGARRLGFATATTPNY
jgi:Eukaryotic aspartyl protease